MEGRIFFKDNPWPEGHRIVTCKWKAFIHPALGIYSVPDPQPSLCMEFELVSADYYADDPVDPDDDSDVEDDSELSVTEDAWSSKLAWNNYHCAWIGSSQTSELPGIVVSNGSKKFEFDADTYDFAADPLPIDMEEFFQTQAFGIYLLGHDAVADHRIRLERCAVDGSYALDWRGKIALYYSGKTDFKHEFSARFEGLRFDAISLPYLDPAIAKDHLGIDAPALNPRDYIAPFVSNPDRFRFEDRNGVMHAVLEPI